MRYFEKAIEQVARVSGLGAGIALLAAMLIVTGNVFCRYFDIPLDWAFDWANVLALASFALAVSYGHLKRGHIGVTTIVARLPQLAGRITRVVTASLCLIFLGLVIWSCWLYFLQQVNVSYYTIAANLPVFWFTFLLIPSFASMALFFLLSILKEIRGFRQ